MLANLLAMPIVSAWVMPMGILGVIAIPFGFDAEFWRQMGFGIDWMDAVALWVASLPGAFGRVTSFGTGPLLLGTAALLVIGLLKTPLRWSGALRWPSSRSFGRRARRLPDVLDIRRRADSSRCAAPTAGSRSITVAVTLLRSANGLRPMPMAATSAIQGSAEASPATPPAASARSPTAASSPMRLRPTPSKRIAGVRGS